MRNKLVCFEKFRKDLGFGCIGFCGSLRSGWVLKIKG